MEANVSQPGMRIGIVTLGCDKNTVDNEYLAGILDRHGVEAAAADLPADGAEFDAVLINTCGFVESARVESVRTILTWIEHKNARASVGEHMRVFVAGCLPQRYREELIAELPEVDGFMGVGEFEKVLRLVQSPPDAAGSTDLIQEMPSVRLRESLPRKALGAPSPHAFLKISDGCSHRCAFCAIPSFKGPFQSVPKDILLAEAQMLLSRGVREINLVAQDTSAYGLDIYGRTYGIAELLAELAALPGDFWLRTLYFYPGGVTRRFLDAFTSSPKIVPYLDMPLQHLHPDVLDRMRRPKCRADIGNVIAKLRSARGDAIAVRTTFITGFPGETDEEFHFLLDGVRALRFERLGAFAFSKEEGTPAAAMRPQIPRRRREARLARLMKLQAGISAEANQAQIGLEKRVLIEGMLPDGRYAGRSEMDAPGVDGLVIVTAPGGLKPGGFAHVRITSADTYDLFAQA